MGVRYVFNDPVVIAICHTDDQVTIPCKNQILRLSSVTKFHILSLLFFHINGKRIAFTCIFSHITQLLIFEYLSLDTTLFVI